MSTQYSTTNFIVPITDADTSVKIRDIYNRIKKLLTDVYCNMYVQNNYLIVKQKSDTKATELAFASAAEAQEALVLLDAAFRQLRSNLSNTGASGSYCDDKFSPVYAHLIWTRSEDLPIIPPSSLPTTLVDRVIELPLAHITGTTSFASGLFVDPIPPSFGAGYAVVVKTQAGQVIPSGFNGMSVDYDCGLVKFNAFSLSGTYIITPAAPPTVTFYKYIGPKGLIAATTFPTWANKNMQALNVTEDGRPAISQANALASTPPLNSYVQVSINGIIVKVGNGWDGSSAPDFHALFAAKLPDVINVGADFTFASDHNLGVGQKFIAVDGTGAKAFTVLAVLTPAILTVAETPIGTVESDSAYLHKNIDSIDAGDVILFFPSYSGYELDSTDYIDFFYLRYQ